jgi:hypothetical protein
VDEKVVMGDPHPEEEGPRAPDGLDPFPAALEGTSRATHVMVWAISISEVS